MVVEPAGPQIPVVNAFEPESVLFPKTPSINALDQLGSAHSPQSNPGLHSTRCPSSSLSFPPFFFFLCALIVFTKISSSSSSIVEPPRRLFFPRRLVFFATRSPSSSLTSDDDHGDSNSVKGLD
ncbi:hypothetical protein M407DRAFT_241619 [Tulasnella calospora MUT 4182]|uniref:Uncharacterized protein n=1 Tax=Tulasnella calospora MUT 4182 TaxID=1051891 RepID=A0A0C3QII4_9AGAM|nr:hypothetical protein M407DRAFT_241619 [Tulasnella calospora MUT 4182]